MNCISLMPAQQVITDMQSKRISLINVFESFTVNILPIFIPITVLTSVERTLDEPANPELTLEIKLNDGLIFTNRLIINFSGESTLAKNIISIPALTITHAGKLLFELKYDNTIIGTYYLVVKSSSPQGNPVQQG